MNRRFELSDAEWARLEPFLPAQTPKRDSRWRNHRQVPNGILFRTRTGIPWRHLPDRYGPWQTVYHCTGVFRVIDPEGTRPSELARRAGITPQGMAEAVG